MVRDFESLECLLCRQGCRALLAGREPDLAADAARAGRLCAVWR